ncbi:unnamed protein product [Orchesella dallaii]|uniref:Uncharacterized protein n=1 Tax=Orchesella dallaii TaxID=48710 RepID=A0ABP1Q3V9_9HEXA
MELGDPKISKIHLIICFIYMRKTRISGKLKNRYSNTEPQETKTHSKLILAFVTILMAHAYQTLNAIDELEERTQGGEVETSQPTKKRQRMEYNNRDTSLILLISRPETKTDESRLPTRLKKVNLKTGSLFQKEVKEKFEGVLGDLT